MNKMLSDDCKYVALSAHLVRLFATVRHFFDCNHLVGANISCLAEKKVK